MLWPLPKHNINIAKFWRHFGSFFTVQWHWPEGAGAGRGSWTWQNVKLFCVQRSPATRILSILFPANTNLHMFKNIPVSGIIFYSYFIFSKKQLDYTFAYPLQLNPLTVSNCWQGFIRTCFLFDKILRRVAVKRVEVKTRWPSQDSGDKQVNTTIPPRRG